MSRHEIAARKLESYKIIVGWDPPMKTYFAHVIDRRKESSGDDDKIIMWLGGMPGEIQTVDRLAHRLRNFAELSNEMRLTLYGDRDESRA